MSEHAENDVFDSQADDGGVQHAFEDVDSAKGSSNEGYLAKKWGYSAVLLAPLSLTLTIAVLIKLIVKSIGSTQGAELTMGVLPSDVMPVLLFLAIFAAVAALLAGLERVLKGDSKYSSLYIILLAFLLGAATFLLAYLLFCLACLDLSTGIVPILLVLGVIAIGFLQFYEAALSGSEEGYGNYVLQVITLLALVLAISQAV